MERKSSSDKAAQHLSGFTNAKPDCREWLRRKNGQNLVIWFSAADRSCQEPKKAEKGAYSTQMSTSNVGSFYFGTIYENRTEPIFFIPSPAAAHILRLPRNELPAWAYHNSK